MSQIRIRRNGSFSCNASERNIIIQRYPKISTKKHERASSMRGQFDISKSKGASAPVVVLSRVMPTFVAMKWWFSRSSLISSPFPNYRVVPTAGGDYALSVICKRALAHWVSPAPAFSHPPHRVSPSFIGLSMAKLYAEWQNVKADFALFAPTLAYLAAIITFHDHSGLDESLISSINSMP